MSASIQSRFVEVDGLRLHYREQGTGAPVLLLHGWPTSSYLWRDVMGPIAARGSRAIALDLPGFGQSDKPVASYSFRFYERLLTKFLDALGIDSLSLVVHDLGGPIGLYWASKHEARLRKLALLNTIVYPELSWAVAAFVAACRLPLVRSLMSSGWGLKQAMHIGVADRSRLSTEAIAAVQAPFETAAARRALLSAGSGLHPAGLKEIAEWLRTVRIPVRVLYGARDRILPGMDDTMRRVQRDVPHAEVTAFADCGHFLQEERGVEIGEMLGTFFASEQPLVRAS